MALSTLAGDPVGAIARDAAATEAQLDERIAEMIEAAPVSTEPPRRAVVP